MTQKPKSRDNVLTEEEIELLKNSCNSETEKLVVYGLLFSGMRISEFIHFRRSWIGKRDNTEFIKIPLQMKCPCCECKRTHEGKPAGLWRGKTKYAERTLPILDELKEILDVYFAKHETIIETVSSRIRAWEIVKQVAKRSKIDHKVFPHCIRATFATILAKKGFDAIFLQHAMGWKKISMAEEYVRLSGTAILDEFKRKW